jgi:DASS family divalent anion:Na+ symporter
VTDWDTASQVLLAEPVFDAVPRREVARFLSHVVEEEVAAGEVLHIRLEPTENTYLIVSGRFDITGTGGGKTEISEGFLGEEAALGLDSYLATAIAMEDSKVLCLPKSALRDLTKHGPIMERMLASYSGRFSGRGDPSGAKPAEKEKTPEEKP